MNEEGKKQKKNSYELAKNCTILGESFGKLDLLTNTFKTIRHKARVLLKKEIDAMYSEG